jgi:hypothetical protein
MTKLLWYVPLVQQGRQVKSYHPWKMKIGSNLTSLPSYTLCRINLLADGVEVSFMSYWPDTDKLWIVLKDLFHYYLLYLNTREHFILYLDLLNMYQATLMYMKRSVIWKKKIGRIEGKRSPWRYSMKEEMRHPEFCPQQGQTMVGCPRNMHASHLNIARF